MSMTSSDTIRAKFLPAEKREGTALCLSGGGYRAALFHLGVCRRFNELDVLSTLNAVSAVSGGSIFVAHLARCIKTSGQRCFSEYEDTVAVPFRKFVKNDIRTTPALARLLPWEWWNAGAGAEALAGEYEEHLVDKMTLADLPETPKFTFCATDLNFGVDWVFSRDRVGDYQAGYMDGPKAASQSVAVAVAASSCFPPVFRPLPMNLEPSDLKGGLATNKDRDSYVRQLVLSDGGVYDNLGLEPVWKFYATIFVSDGGRPFQFAKDHGTPQQLYRIHDVMANQAEAVRKRWLISSYIRGDFTGAYLGIGNSVSDFPASDTTGYSKGLATEVLANIRTDMDCFSDDEIAALENHGYTLADAAYRAHACPPDKVVPALKPLNNPWWPASPSSLAALEGELREALADSATFHILGH
jgi:NTE family protein